MPWDGKTPAERAAEQAFYSDPVYKANRAIARRRAGGRCEQCGHRHPRLQCDHIIPRTQGGGHEPENLRMLCAGDGSCKCHERKTAGEGGGYRASSPTRTPRDPRPTPRTQW